MVQPLGLLDLPGEIRNDIYCYALKDLRDAPSTPYAVFKTNSDTYNALRWSNNQVAKEIRGIFDTDFAPNITLYVSSAPQLYAAVEAFTSDHPVLATARFKLCLRSKSGSQPCKGRNILGLDRFIGVQHASMHWDAQHLAIFDIMTPAGTNGACENFFDLQCGGSTLTTTQDYSCHSYGYTLGKGISYQSYNTWSREDEVTAKEERAWFHVLEGRLGDVVMDSKAIIECMRDVKEGGKKLVDERLL